MILLPESQFTAWRKNPLHDDAIAAFLLKVAVLASGLRVHDALSQLISKRLQGLLSLWLPNTSKSSLVKSVISLLFWQWVSVNDIGAFLYKAYE